LIDTSNVSVTADTLGEGVTALNSAGEEITGTLKVSDEIVTTAGTGSAYTATVKGIKSLTAGVNFIMIPHVVSASTAPTLNVNGLGAKTIRQPLTTNTSATTTGASNTWLAVNKPVRVMYDGTYWKTVEIPRPSATGLYGTVPIKSGGTGATTEDAACTNLGAVRYVAQTLTEEQKKQARANLGLSGSATVTPQDYGAIGDGTTDDITAFQNALNNNRRVFVPGGNYSINGEIIIQDNCELELAQDVVLYFKQTSGNCISLKQCAHLKGNHATVSVPYAFTGKVINADTGLSASTNECPPFAKWDPQWKTGRYVTNINIVKPDSRGFYYSVNGDCNGTAVYICTDGSDVSKFMWGVNFSGLRIAGAFSYGIQAQNFGSGYNHEMRVEAVIDACDIGVSIENVNNAYISAIVQPRVALTTAEVEIPYAKHGIQLIDSRNADLSGSRVWDWNAKNSLWAVGSEYQHLAMRGNCSGAIVNDFFYYEIPNYDIRSLIYTDTPSNLEKITILQEPFTRWFKSIDHKPHFFDGDADRPLVLQSELDALVHYDMTPTFTDQLAIAGDGSGGVFNEVGYTRSGYWDTNGTTFTADQYLGCTGYVKIEPGKVIRVRGMSLVGASDDSRIIIFNSSYTKISHFNASAIPAATYFLSYTAVEDGFDITVLPNGNCANAAYVKFNVPSANITSFPVISVGETIGYEYAGVLAEGIKVQIEQVDGLSEILGSYINEVDTLIGGGS